MGLTVLLGCVCPTVQGSSWADREQFTPAARAGVELE